MKTHSPRIFQVVITLATVLFGVGPIQYARTQTPRTNERIVVLLPCANYGTLRNCRFKMNASRRRRACGNSSQAGKSKRETDQGGRNQTRTIKSPLSSDGS